MTGKTFVRLWLAVQWLCMFPFAAGGSYLLFSDVHGVPTAGFYFATFGILIVSTIGFLAAQLIVKSWPERY